MYILYNHFNITYTILLKHTTFNLFPFKHSITTALSTSVSTCRTKYAACYICDSIVRSDWYRTIHVDSLCGQHAYPYARKTDLPSHGVEWRGDLVASHRVALVCGRPEGARTLSS